MSKKKDKKKKRFKMRKGKNLFVQAALMLPISAVQTFAGAGSIFGLYSAISVLNGGKDDGLGVFGGIAMCAIFAAIAVGLAILMVKFKGAEATELEWNPNFGYDFKDAYVKNLKNAYFTAKKYYKLSEVPTDIIGNEELLRAFYAGEIQSIDLTDMSESDRRYILNELADYKLSGGEELHLTVPTVIWALLSPVAFLLQWIALCAAINQLSSRRIFSCYGELPFSSVCLKFSTLQEICHFLFNFVIISNIKVFNWMGSIDEKEKMEADA